jgi:hypothetical protein
MNYAGLTNVCDPFCVNDLKNVSRNDLTQAEDYYQNWIPSCNIRKDWFQGKNTKKVELLINFTIYKK